MKRSSSEKPSRPFKKKKLDATSHATTPTVPSLAQSAIDYLKKTHDELEAHDDQFHLASSNALLQMSAERKTLFIDALCELNHRIYSLLAAGIKHTNITPRDFLADCSLSTESRYVELNSWKSLILENKILRREARQAYKLKSPLKCEESSSSNESRGSNLADLFKRLSSNCSSNEACMKFLFCKETDPSLVVCQTVNHYIDQLSNGLNPFVER